MSKVKWPARVPDLTLSYDSAQARARGREDGYRSGYHEGYLRGRADVIASRRADPVPFRQIRVLYIASGKGFPYSPLDEAISSTLRSMEIGRAHV